MSKNSNSKSKPINKTDESAKKTYYRCFRRE